MGKQRRNRGRLRPPFTRPAFRNTFPRFFLFLFTRIDNATGAVYDKAPSYPGPPRAVVAAGRFTFGG